MSHFVVNGERTLEYDEEQALLTVTLPIAFTRYKGKTEITTPNGEPVLTEKGRHPCPTLRDALVRSHQWHQWLREGKYRSVKALAEKAGINNKAYPTFIMSLYSLSPTIQEAILTGKGLDYIAPFRELRTRTIPWAWEEQSGYLKATKVR